MSLLVDKINSDLKKSMQAGEKLKTSVLRMLLSSIKNKEIELRGNGKPEINDKQVEEVAVGEVKKRKDSIEAFLKGGRNDLVDVEKAEILVLEKYIPRQLSDIELENIVKSVMERKSENKTVMFGAIMGEVMAKVKGSADGGRVSAVVKKFLNQ